MKDKMLQSEDSKWEVYSGIVMYPSMKASELHDCVVFSLTFSFNGQGVPIVY